MTEAEPILNGKKNDSTFRKIKSTEKQDKRRQMPCLKVGQVLVGVLSLASGPYMTTLNNDSFHKV